MHTLRFVCKDLHDARLRVVLYKAIGYIKYVLNQGDIHLRPYKYNVVPDKTLTYSIGLINYRREKERNDNKDTERDERMMLLHT